MKCSIYTQWLSKYMNHELNEVIEVYIEAMNEDVGILIEHIDDKNHTTTLNVLHRIKGGLGAIGFDYMYTLSEKTHSLGVNKDDSYKENLENLISELKKSISIISNIPMSKL